MVSTSKTENTPSTRRTAVLLMDWGVAGIAPPTDSPPAPQTPVPQEIAERTAPMGYPATMGNPTSAPP